MKFKFFGGKFAGQYIDVPTDEAGVPPSLFTIGCMETPGLAHRYYRVCVSITGYGIGTNGYIFASSDYGDKGSIHLLADILVCNLGGAKPDTEES